MTERDDHIFDKIIRDKISPYTEPVPDDIWNNISKKRNSVSFLQTHYKLFFSVIMVMILALMVTIPMTNKINDEKQILPQSVSKKHLSNVLFKNPEKSTINVKQNQYSNDKKFKSVVTNKISEKAVIQTKSNVKITSIINKSSKNPTVKGQNGESATTIIHQNLNKNETGTIPDKESGTYDQSPRSITTKDPSIIETAFIVPIIQTTSAQTNTNVFIPVTNVNIQSDTPTANRISPEIIADKTLVVKPDNPMKAPVTDSNSTTLPENIVSPASIPKSHFSCIDFIISPGLITKSVEASNPAFESYARMLDRVTKTRYSLGFEIRYRYYLNQFWNIATGLKYNQVNEQMLGQIKPEQIIIKQTTGMIITPFNPPKQIIISDTIRIPANTISQINNTFSYLQIPVLLGANFSLFKIPLNLYAGVEYFYSIKQKGSYINSSTFELSDFQTSLENPFKDAQGLSIRAGINASIQMSRRSAFLIGVDYSRFVISINDPKYQIHQYYSIFDLNLGITYQLF